MTDDPYKPSAKIPRSPKPTWSYAFRDVSGRTVALQVLFWIGVAVALVALVSDLMQAQLLSDMIAGRRVSHAEADSHDSRQGLLRVLEFILFVITAVVFLMWVHRANSNARVLATGRMEFTPGWSVGWFFVPIWNLWKPFQVLREIWRVSQEGARHQKPTGLVVVWWTLLLACMVVKLQAATLIRLVSHMLQVGLCIVAVLMVSRILRMQLERLVRRKAAAQENAAQDGAARENDADATDQGQGQPVAS